MPMRWTSRRTVARALEAHAADYDPIILDLMLPGIDGVSVRRSVRASKNAVPILVVTARDAVDARVEGLDAGADDTSSNLSTSGSSLRVFVRWLIRRGRQRCSVSISRSALCVVDTRARLASIGGRNLSLTAAKNYALLEFRAEAGFWSSHVRRLPSTCGTNTTTRFRM